MTYTPNSEYQPPMPEPPMLQPQMVVTPWGLPFYVSGNEAHDRKMYFEQIRREMHKYITKFNEDYLFDYKNVVPKIQAFCDYIQSEQ